MISSLLLTLREGLEAALIISLVLGGLKRINRPDLNRIVWQGAISALILSVLAAIALDILGTDFKDPAESIFEGLSMLLAAGILTWMIFWMQRQARFLKSEIETNVRTTMANRGGQGLFFLSFLAVIREGLELALYLFAVRVTSNPLQILLGAVLGLAGAVAFGWLLFTSTHRFNLRRFFQVTNILLVIFAAGLVANGAHELIISGWIPAGIAQVWNISHLLNENSGIGQILNTLVGYNSQPSLTEILAYLGYVALILAGFLWGRQRVTQRVRVLDHQQK
jgi:high-affinity iron transporter